jgi:hypothetical protein
MRDSWACARDHLGRLQAVLNEASNNPLSGVSVTFNAPGTGWDISRQNAVLQLIIP